MRLSAPAVYFPPAKGRYVTTPDLLPPSTDFGNGPIDAKLFQFDATFPEFRQSKLDALKSHPERHSLTDDFDSKTERAVCERLAERLESEWPEFFVCEGGSLLCNLTGERSPLTFGWLCEQVQEDLVVVRRSTERGEWNAALHVCAPSHWRPEEKIGQGYATTHAPVPGIERQKSAAPALVDVLVNRGPFVRFTWGIAFDGRLNQHPELGKSEFDPENLFFRVERQTLLPLPDLDAFVFGIRLYVTPLGELPPEKQLLLAEALESMSPEARDYKGIARNFNAIVERVRDYARTSPERDGR